MSDGDRHPAIDWLVERLAREPWVEKVILYGSRARGTARPYSDIDVAVVGAPPQASDWSRLALDIDDEVPTLLGLDLVLLNELAADVRTRALRDGRVLYERH